MRPSVVALPLMDTVFDESQAGMRTAGVKDPKVSRKVLELSVSGIVQE